MFKAKRSSEEIMAFQAERAKFEMQIRVTWYIFFVCFALFAVVCWKGTIEDIKSLLEKIMIFFGLGITYWLGTSKGAADNRDQLNKLLPPPAPVLPAPPAVPEVAVPVPQPTKESP